MVNTFEALVGGYVDKEQLGRNEYPAAENEILTSREIIKSDGIKPVRLPARSPDLNSYSERVVLSIKSECLSKLIFFEEQSLRKAITEYVTPYHKERNHQGRGNILLFPSSGFDPDNKTGSIRCSSRLDRMLNCYYREVL